MEMFHNIAIMGGGGGGVKKIGSKTNQNHSLAAQTCFARNMGFIANVGALVIIFSGLE